MSEDSYDDFFLHILTTGGNYTGFLDKIFDFLYRRTDYFRVKPDNSSNYGLVAGEAENIIRSVFCKYMKQAYKSRLSNPKPPELDPDCIREEIVETTAETCETETVPIIPTQSTDSLEESSNPEMTPDIEPRITLMDPDCYNGACLEGYSWSQTLRDTDIRLKVPSEVSTGKQVRVEIEKTRIKVELLQDTEWRVLKEGDLLHKIKKEESTWTLIPGEHIHICLQKEQERWWDAFFESDPKINLKTIDASIPIQELDVDSQNKIEELMYNEHLKHLGQPTIQQRKIQNILKDAWDTEGSPFKGQPYDPTLIDIEHTPEDIP